MMINSPRTDFNGSVPPNKLLESIQGDFLKLKFGIFGNAIMNLLGCCKCIVLMNVSVAKFCNAVDYGSRR